MAGKYKIVMVRHGESEWNQQNLFCGWYDANLSDKGKVTERAYGIALDVICGRYYVMTRVNNVDFESQFQYKSLINGIYNLID